MNAMPQTENLDSAGDVFRHPLEFIFAEHDRQRIVCAVIERIADDLLASDVRANAAHIVDHLENNLPLHIADEENDLFPMMWQRCLDDDGLNEILTLLQEEHKEDDTLCAALLGPLRVLAEGGQPEDAKEFIALAQGFARFQRRHLGWENGTLLPLAERRLTDADQAELGRSMAARRSITIDE